MMIEMHKRFFPKSGLSETAAVCVTVDGSVVTRHKLFTKDGKVLNAGCYERPGPGRFPHKYGWEQVRRPEDHA